MWLLYDVNFGLVLKVWLVVVMLLLENQQPRFRNWMELSHCAKGVLSARLKFAYQNMGITGQNRIRVSEFYRDFKS
jgi:hypothetical protein